MGDCLSDQEISDFCDCRLKQEALRAAQQHLAHCDACVILVRDAAAGLSEEAPRDTPLDDHSDLQSVVVAGRYRLLELLGQGAFGEVWRAADEKNPWRQMAVKLLRSDWLNDADVRQRFEGEGLALELLGKHENLVAVAERSEWNGRPYIVMEYAEGERLDAWLEEHRRAGQETEFGTVLKIFNQLCAGLEAAHAAPGPRRILHRDLKPENVVLCRAAGAEIHVKVLDFGLARLGEGRKTRSGQVLGTFPYMAPEQAMATPARQGPWTDVFSLGVILSEMLTLTRLADWPKPIWGMAVAGEDIGAEIAKRRPDLPPKVLSVLRKALSGDEAQRFPDAGALRRAMQEARAAPRPASPRWQRSPWWYLVGAVGLLLAVTWWLRSPSREPGTQAKGPAEQRLLRASLRIEALGHPGTPGRYLAAGDAVRAGEQLHFRITADQPAYLYVAQLEPTGGVTQVALAADEKERLMSAGTPESVVFDLLDEAGVNVVFVVVSLKRIARLEDAVCARASCRPGSVHPTVRPSKEGDQEGERDRRLKAPTAPVLFAQSDAVGVAIFRFSFQQVP